MDPPTPPPMTPPAILPVNVLLEIVARSDVTTAIRCAATSTRLRTAILDPSFRRRLHLAAGRRRFDPARLLAVSYSSGDYGGNGIIQLRRPRHARLESTTLLQPSFHPVSSRDGLLVLRRSGDDMFPSDDMFVLAVHADEEQAATSIELPEGCVTGEKESCSLAVTGDGRRLSVLVADAEAIVVWTLSSPESEKEEEEGWSRHAVIGRRGIYEQVTGGDRVVGKAVFQGFGERSGAVLVHIDMVGLVLLDMETKKAVLLRGCGEVDRRAYQYERAWLHEVDLATLLQGMKDIRRDSGLVRLFNIAMMKKNGGEIVTRTMKIPSRGEIVAARKEAPSAIPKFSARWRQVA